MADLKRRLDRLEEKAVRERHPTGEHLVAWMTDAELVELEQILSRDDGTAPPARNEADMDRANAIVQAAQARWEATGGAPPPPGGYREDAAQT